MNLKWENALLGTILDVASEKSVHFKNIESANARFSGDRFFIIQIRTTDDVIYGVEVQVPDIL